jgi:hypothetical protein
MGHGVFTVWSSRSPERIELDGESVPFTFDAASGRLDFEIPVESQSNVFRMLI